MKRAVRAVLVVALAAPVSVALAVVLPGTAFACSCAYYTDGSQAAEQLADFAAVDDNLVFTGTPMVVRHSDYTDYYEFDIREVFRGDVGARTTVSTADDSAACGTSFDLKEEYLVFATTYDTQDAPWSVNMCSATTSSTNEVTRTATVAQFGEPREVTAAKSEGVNSRSLAVWVGAGLALALAAGVTGWLFRRRRG